MDHGSPNTEWQICVHQCSENMWKGNVIKNIKWFKCDWMMMMMMMMEITMKTWHITVWTSLFSVLHAHILLLSHWHHGGAGAPFTPLKEPLRIAFTTTASALVGLLSNWTAQRSLKKTSSSVWNAGSCYSWTVMCAFAIFQWRCLQFKCNAHTPGGYAWHKERFQPKKKKKDCACSRSYVPWEYMRVACVSLPVFWKKKSAWNAWNGRALPGS